MNYRLRKSALALAVAALVAAPAAAVADDHVDMMPDDSWISVSGTVDEVSPHSFILDYGDDSIIVEMDDWDADADGYKLVPGDSVTVTGLVDNDLFEAKTIEAGSVYVESLNTYFYASSADEEDAYVSYTVMIDPGQLNLQGTVTEVSGDEFVIDTGWQKIEVNVSEMPYDPLDDEGFQKITKGDRVSVSGKMGTDFFVDRDFMADSVITLQKRSS
ncbi:MAG: DUF5666 domain-containing protein [Xanthomonadales bacterium]|nr:DUF5666 domain-containing protein [Xanthomonadales bacterium]